LRSAFDLGAHFTLYKPISAERAKSSFRAARALMKKERRRNSRIAVSIPVKLSSRESGAHFQVTTTDLGEGGMALSVPRRSKLQGRWDVTFTLPGLASEAEVAAEFAWEGTGTQAGLRFEDPSEKFVQQLREWISRNSADAEKDDPPLRCQLTDLSLGGCYLEVTSPFPVSTRVTLAMRAKDLEMKAEGVVRVMHPEKGMGVEFIQGKPEHRESIEKLLSLLAESDSAQPEVLVEPEGLEAVETATKKRPAATVAEADVLLALFRDQHALPADAFLAELRKQRAASAAV